MFLQSSAFLFFPLSRNEQYKSLKKKKKNRQKTITFLSLLELAKTTREQLEKRFSD